MTRLGMGWPSLDELCLSLSESVAEVERLEAHLHHMMCEQLQEHQSSYARLYMTMCLKSQEGKVTSIMSRVVSSSSTRVSSRYTHSS